MPSNAKSGRSHAEERFNKARKTDEEARAIIDLERDALRKKTARLRKLRLAQEAKEAAAPAKTPKKAVPKKSAAKKPVAKKPVSKKAVAKKPVAKKAVAKKAAGGKK